MTADDEGDDSSRLLSRQGPDLQDGGASSETRDDIFASGVGNRVGRPKSRSGAEAQLVLVWRSRRVLARERPTAVVSCDEVVAERSPGPW